MPTAGRIINGWLVLIVVVGAVIAVADGRTRAPNPGLELDPPQPLEYVPYRAAFLLAAVTFPLMVGYAKKARISSPEGLFLWFVFCTTAYMKDFSYLRWPGVPLFVTDTVLLLLLLLTYISPPRPGRPRFLNISLALFVAAGMLAAARGFMANRETILVLRDSAMIEYSLFLLVGYHVFKSWLAIRRLAIWFTLGTILSIITGLGWLLVAPEQRRFVAPGIYVFISLVGVLVVMANRLIRPRVGCVLVGIFLLGLLLANTRTLFVTLAILCLLALFVPGFLRGRVRSVGLASALTGATILACLLVLIFSHLHASRDLTTRAGKELASGVLHSSDDPNWQFRLMAWKEAWRRFRVNPASGEGFGNLFNFEIWDNDPRPHNTFLTVLYKMGLLGFVPFFGVVFSFFWFTLRAIRRHPGNRHLHLLQVIILAEFSFCMWGETNFVIESPFLASLFWTGIGIGFRIVEKFDMERETEVISNYKLIGALFKKTQRRQDPRHTKTLT